MKAEASGRITISRPAASWGEKYIEIKLDDDASGCRLVSVRLSLDCFAEAVTGLGYVPCVFDYYDECPVGKVRQNKTELLPKPKHSQKDREATAKILAPFEIQGWRGEASDLFNHHRYIGEKVAVNFSRFIEAEIEGGK